MGRKSSKSTISNPTVQVFPEAKDALVAWLQGVGRSQSWTVSRILTWFVAQPESIKRVVLNEASDMTAEYAAVLRMLADELDPNPDPSVEKDRIRIIDRISPKKP